MLSLTQSVKNGAFAIKFQCPRNTKIRDSVQNIILRNHVFHATSFAFLSSTYGQFFAGMIITLAKLPLPMTLRRWKSRIDMLNVWLEGEGNAFRSASAFTGEVEWLYAAGWGKDKLLAVASSPIGTSWLLSWMEPASLCTGCELEEGPLPTELWDVFLMSGFSSRFCVGNDLETKL